MKKFEIEIKEEQCSRLLEMFEPKQIEFAIIVKCYKKSEVAFFHQYNDSEFCLVIELIAVDIKEFKLFFD